MIFTGGEEFAAVTMSREEMENAGHATDRFSMVRVVGRWRWHRHYTARRGECSVLSLQHHLWVCKYTCVDLMEFARMFDWLVE